MGGTIITIVITRVVSSVALTRVARRIVLVPHRFTKVNMNVEE